MDRRNFIGAVAVAGGTTVGLASAAGQSVKEDAAMECVVKGFSCLTCAIGLEALLRQQAGVTQAKADYHSGHVRIAFDSHKISSTQIKRLIEDTGFKLVG